MKKVEAASRRFKTERVAQGKFEVKKRGKMPRLPVFQRGKMPRLL
jgi:hypothetical protein